MSYSVHQVPGRIRINTPLLRKNSAMAAAVLDCLDTRRGILSAKASPLTGSITVYYDVREICARSILSLMHDCGFVSETAPATSGLNLSALGPDKKVVVGNFIVSLAFKVISDWCTKSLVAGIA